MLIFNVIRFCPLHPTAETARHEVTFYSNDRHLLEYVTRFIGAALTAGDAVIIVSTESYRESLLPRLQAYGLEIGEAIQQGRYSALDAGEMIRTFIVDGMVDSRRFLDGFGNLIQNATKAARRKYLVLQSSERVPIYWLRKGTWKPRFRTKGSATD